MAVCFHNHINRRDVSTYVNSGERHDPLVYVFSVVQTLEGLARALRLDKFLQLMFEAGLLDQLQTGPEMTIFVPADKAFNGLLFFLTCKTLDIAITE